MLRLHKFNVEQVLRHIYKSRGLQLVQDEYKVRGE